MWFYGYEGCFCEGLSGVDNLAIGNKLYLVIEESVEWYARNGFPVAVDFAKRPSNETVQLWKERLKQACELAGVPWDEQCCKWFTVRVEYSLL